MTRERPTIGELPSRLSGWLSHTFNNGSSPPSDLPIILNNRKSSILNVVKHKSHLDKAVRYFLDSDSTTTTSLTHDPIWLLGKSYSQDLNKFQNTFIPDFTSRIWITYRSQFPPIRESLDSSPVNKRWNWPGSEKGWTSDSGWGCMLRTGQSILANALLFLHLGRDWRRPPYPVYSADYATYVQIITYFLDTPSPLAPFSVHRMALAGKDQGTDVGQWFGPSTAAGAIKSLVNAFPDAGLGVSVAADGTLYQSDVFAQSHGPDSPRVPGTWGDRAVLMLVGIRLGLDGVNPVYHDAIKALYTWPQSVGIAGGRPASSYYFVGVQADNLFYLDPHHARPAVPLQPLPPHARHRRAQTSPSSTRSSSAFSLRTPRSSSSAGGSSHGSDIDERDREHAHPVAGGSGAGLDALQAHYATAYPPAELRTFHCERVRKMPLGALDPSMLLGFLCRDAADWADLRARVDGVARAHRAVFTVQDEPPTWPADGDDDMGLESISEPDEASEEEEAVGDFFARSRPGSPARAEEVEDGWVDPAPREDARARALPAVPFPRGEVDGEEEWGERGDGVGALRVRMHAGRARDGGRTQSGGVRGVV